MDLFTGLSSDSYIRSASQSQCPEPPRLTLGRELPPTFPPLSYFPLWQSALSCPRPAWWAGQGVCGQGQGWDLSRVTQ